MKNYFVMSILILSASSMAQNHAFGEMLNFAMPDASAGNFAILASTYANTLPGTTISGDLGYTTGPAQPVSVSGHTHVNDGMYAQAGAFQNNAISFANSKICTTSFGTSVDLSLVQGGVYTPGVYCIKGSASIGPGGITLSGNGIYIFHIGGTLVTTSNSAVNLSNGAQASYASWVPAGTTTLGANSNFAGVILDASGVTLGNNVSITGKILAFGGTVSTNADTITVSQFVIADAVADSFQCTFTFPPGTIDLGSNVQYPSKVYQPGVYCIDGAANIGSGPITLTGNGPHVFKINGAFNQAANTNVILSNGAQVSGVVWIPTGPITIGANSHLIGTVDGAPITIGANSDINGMGSAKVMADAVSGNFGILSSTYTNTLPGTFIVGDLGYTRGPEVAATVNGITHVADSVYSQAGVAQNAATSFTNSQVCTTNLSGIAVDLSQANDGVYTPGVYCTTGAASIGAGGITLSGNGIYIFKISGALTTVANSAINLSDGAKASLVFWAPTAATTLGANTEFAGTILDASGVTISHNVSVTGKVLAFGGTVSTDDDTITVPLFEMADAVADSFQCTVTFPSGAIDLGSNVQYSDKVYPPGIYCIDGALNIGSGPITLSGNGAHIFKINGALGQAANTDVILANGALSSGVVWVPTGATTIGANSHLIGTVTGAPITIGANSDINGMGPATVMADKISGRSQCTVTFPSGAIDLGSNVQYPSKVYPPGVYCIDGALNIGSGPITLSGNGAHIFKINGALGQAANTDVILDNGAQVSGVIWVPTGATTIGANSHLIGTVTGAPITIGANSDIRGMGPATIMADKISGRSQCTVTFPSGAIDLGSNVQYPSKVYPPGVYCINGALNIGSGPITLSGNGNHIFKINGALGQAANTDVILANGALSSSVIWVPTGPITIGANSHLIGTVNGAPITIGANSDINGMGPATTMADAIADNFQCTVTFPTGAIDLGSNVQYADKVYPPGVYCIDGALNIGSGPITLTGNGPHVFKSNGAFNQAANTDVILDNGAQVSSVIWVPTGAITIGANSHLIGTVNGAPITIGANSDVNGMGPAKVMADAVSGNFGILASTYTNTSPGTSIAGDLGYTTGPAVASTISGSTHVVDFVYSQAGTAQYDAISSANSQVCTSNLGSIVDLSLVNGGVYTPGVYCTTGAASIGSGGITLSGDGIYIFKINGALTTVAHSIVTLSNGAQASYVSWVPTGATTLGANSKFAGTILDAEGVTIGSNVSITGSVLAFGGTVSTDADTITVPSYAMSDATTAPSGPLYATGDTSTVPEFGPAAAMILAIAIVSIIAVSARTRLGIIPKY